MIKYKNSLKINYEYYKMDKINCVKKINDKCLKFNEGDVEIVSSRPPVFYNTNIRYNNYLVNITTFFQLS